MGEEPSLCVSACAAQADRSNPSKMLGIIHSEQYRWFADMHSILPTPSPAVRGKLRPALILQEAFFVEDWSLVFPVGIQGRSGCVGFSADCRALPAAEQHLVSSPSPLVPGKSDHWVWPGDGVVKPKIKTRAKQWEGDNDERPLLPLPAQCPNKSRHSTEYSTDDVVE